MVAVANSLFSSNTLLDDALITNFILTDSVIEQVYLALNVDETPTHVDVLLFPLNDIPLDVGGLIMI